MSVKENLYRFKGIIPENVQLVAVSKTKPVEIILEAIDAGQQVFGENKVQELVLKQQELPDFIQWHFIGHLQRNKVKLIAPFISLIHSVDSFRLLKEINKEALKNRRIIPLLLQFHIASEDTKFGLDYEEACDILRSADTQNLKNIRISGVMGMATFTQDHNTIRKEFKKLKGIFERLKCDFFSEDHRFKEISMGMSDDYRIAIEEGSTMIRVGSGIFGPRG